MKINNLFFKNDLKSFKENSDESLSNDFLERGYDFYIDGFVNCPRFSVSYIEDSKLCTVNLQCLSIEFENYEKLVSLLEEMSKDKYVFIFSIKPFVIRIASISSEYKLVGIDRTKRVREQKLNKLLNE